MEIRAESFNELVDALYEGSWDDRIARYRSPFVFRGLSNKEYDLATSLNRLEGDYQHIERHLLRNFKKYAHQEFQEKESFWHWLAMAQHHGLPTRLLDWTYSPFVAMHFATEDLNHYSNDAAIWVVNYHKINDLLPYKLSDRLNREGSNVVTVNILGEFAEDLESFDLLNKNDFALFLEPPSMDNRIVNQFALFSIVSNVGRTFDDWLKEHQELYKKIIIPASLKWEIRDKLDQANITERVLFPGLDGLSKWLRRHYSSSPQGRPEQQEQPE